MLRVDLSSLMHAPAGTREYAEVNIRSIKIEDLHLKDLRGQLQLTRVVQGILIHGTLQALAEVECVRCLDLFFTPITLELDYLIRNPGTPLSDEFPVHLNGDGSAILDPLLRESAWLGIPAYPVCREDCPGLCPTCGGHLGRGECVCKPETLESRSLKAKSD